MEIITNEKTLHKGGIISVHILSICIVECMYVHMIANTVCCIDEDRISTSSSHRPSTASAQTVFEHSEKTNRSAVSFARVSSEKRDQYET